MYSVQLPKAKVGDLIPLDYSGQGNEYFEHIIGISHTKPPNLPPYFPELKSKLNETKSRLDKMSKTELKKYEKFTNDNKIAGALPAILIHDYRAEIVSNAWLKMYELLSYCDTMLKTVSTRHNAVLRTMHFAEAPGNFILAINHKIKTTYPQINWIWNANSYLSDKNNIYLGDTYGLIKKYNKNWIYGCDMNGDITSPANIRYFGTLEKYDIVTGDVKYSPPDMDFNEEEKVNIPVQFGQALAALNTLREGGIAILKFLTIYEHTTLDIIALLNSCFSELYITKPQTSKKYNSEIYILGRGYKPRKCPSMEKLLSWLDYLRHNPISTPLFSNVDPMYLHNMRQINTYLMHRQLISLEECLDRYNNAEHIDEITKQEFAKKWIKTYKPRLLELQIINIE